MKTAKIGFVLEKLRILMRESYDVSSDQEQCHDLTSSQCYTLLEIGTCGEVSLVELASSLNLDTSTLSRTVQSLVVLGMVNRTTNAKDRRFVKISLSERGKEIYEAIGRLYYDFITRVFAQIPARKHETVLESIGVFADAMKQANEAGRSGRNTRKR